MRKASRRTRVALVTLGCAKNTADSDLLAGQILHEGIAITPKPEEADAIVVNTCAFLTASQQESIDMILSLLRAKEEAPQEPARRDRLSRAAAWRRPSA